MKPGDIHWFDLPAVGGRVQQGLRPAVAWQDFTLFPHLPTTLIIPLTSLQAALRFGPCYLIQPTTRNGLSVPSVALVFQLNSVDVRWRRGRIGELDDPDLVQIRLIARAVQAIP